MGVNAVFSNVKRYLEDYTVKVCALEKIELMANFNLTTDQYLQWSNDHDGYAQLLREGLIGFVKCKEEYPPLTMALWDFSLYMHTKMIAEKEKAEFNDVFQRLIMETLQFSKQETTHFFSKGLHEIL